MDILVASRLSDMIDIKELFWQFFLLHYIADINGLPAMLRTIEPYSSTTEEGRRLGAETIQWNNVLESKQSILYDEAQSDEHDVEKFEFMQSISSNPAWEHADLGWVCARLRLFVNAKSGSFVLFVLFRAGDYDVSLERKENSTRKRKKKEKR